jgi:hypothetical protein
MRIPFATESYAHRSLPLSAQRVVNCYLEAAPPQAKTFAAVVQSYGLRQLANIGTGYLRGGIVRNGIPYVVAGEKFYRLAANGTATELGDIPGAGYVDMAGDEENIMLVSRGRGWYWNGSTCQQITDEDFPGAEWVESLDGYYIIGALGSGRFYISSNRNPAEWDGLDFASTEKYPDDLVGGIVANGEIFLFGKESFEVWFDSGDADFPLERSSAGFGDIGCLSRFGLAKADNSVFFLGHDGVIYRLNGYQPQRISTHAIEQAIDGYADKTCYAQTWNEGGHKFVAFTFDDNTWVYDIATQLWHERISFGLPNWRALFVIRAFDQWLVGDFYTNAIAELDPDEFAEFGDVLRSSATSPAVSKDNQRMTTSRVELVFEQGVGRVSGQGSDPQVMLRFSDDGGRKWSSEKWRSMGKIGETTKRVVFNRLGQHRDRVYEFAITDPVRRTLILATTDVKVDAA